MVRDSRLRSTAYYDYLNVNPKGLMGYDCVIRAVALMTATPWEQTVRELTELGIKKSRVLNDPNVYPLFLESKGLIAHGEPRDENNRKMSVKAFIDLHPEIDSFVAVVGTHHVTCVIDRKVKDIWDCSGETMHRWWSR